MCLPTGLCFFPKFKPNIYIFIKLKVYNKHLHMQTEVIYKRALQLENRRNFEWMF